MGVQHAWEIVTDEPNILFVDDELDIADYARAIFEMHDYRASIASSGDIALVLLKEGLPFDLLITDVVLPGTLDGYALAVQARLHRPLIPSGILYWLPASRSGQGTRHSFR